MLTPMDIHNREFKKGFRGYNENEVDDFLDRIVNDYEKVLRENEKLKEQANFNEKEIDHYKKLEKNLQDTLMVAQKTAEEVISSAKKNAEEMRTNTARECENLREQALLEAKRNREEAKHKLRSVVAEYDRLAREKNAFLLKLRTTLESELAITVGLLSSMPHIDAPIPTEVPLEKIQSETPKKKIEPAVKPEKVEVEQEKKVEESVEKNFDDTQSIPTVQLFEKVQDETNNESVKSAEEISEK